MGIGLFCFSRNTIIRKNRPKCLGNDSGFKFFWWHIIVFAKVTKTGDSRLLSAALCVLGLAAALLCAPTPRLLSPALPSDRLPISFSTSSANWPKFESKSWLNTFIPPLQRKHLYGSLFPRKKAVQVQQCTALHCSHCDIPYMSNAGDFRFWTGIGKCPHNAQCCVDSCVSLSISFRYSNFSEFSAVVQAWHFQASKLIVFDPLSIFLHLLSLQSG